MKIKIKKQLSDKATARIYSRWKKLSGAFVFIIGCQYLMSDDFTSMLQSSLVSADGGQMFEVDDQPSSWEHDDVQRRHLETDDKTSSSTTTTTDKSGSSGSKTTGSTTKTTSTTSSSATTTSKTDKYTDTLGPMIKQYKACVKDIKSNKCPQFIREYKECLISAKSKNPKTGEEQKCWNGKYYDEYNKIKSSQGYVEEYFSGEHCYSSMLNVPGTALLPKALLGIFYLIFLFWLFLGISVIADIFMEAIEIITSSTKDVQVQDKDGKELTMQVPVWNPTIANLTLMALGSSAPEILLSVIEALKNLGQKAGELGPSSIVGSGAFNLLVISGVSIVAVEEPKKIYDLGVYSCTAFFSIFAYSWMYICLEVTTPDQVDLTEAWFTFFFFFLLVSMAFGFDKLQQSKDEKLAEEQDAQAANRIDELKIRKSALRVQAKVHGEKAVIAIARGIHDESTSGINVEEERKIIATFKECLDVTDLSTVSVDRLFEVLQPDSLLERFAAKRANKVGKTADFLEIKGGVKGQVEHDNYKKPENQNEYIGFKCLHYSVTENAGVAKVTVVKKAMNQSITFGVRTVQDTAVPDSDYKDINVRATMDQNEVEKVFEIPIVDNEEWEPDLDFLVEIYDCESPKQERMSGDDTQCRVTILDEDIPGTLGFEMTDIRVNRNQEKVDVVIKRSDGSAGAISCIVKTEPLTDKNADGAYDPSNAIEVEDYLPKWEEVTFETGEMDRTVSISIVNDKVHHIDGKPPGKTDGDENSEEEEAREVMFKVIIEKSKPVGVKISKRNCAIVTIVSGGEESSQIIQEQKLLEYFLSTRDPTWRQQFQNALLLGPQIDEDDMVVVNVTLWEAVFQFLLYNWKLLFAFIPPIRWGGGKYAFVVALTMIGVITGIVGEVAELIGCVLSLDPQITAITLVAVGTSLPDTFASMTAARTSKYADSAVGNVTGSNSVNVFLGLGLPWVISAVYASNHNQKYVVPAGKLGFSVMMFLITSLCCFTILTTRRIIIGGELGGPSTSKYATAAMCVSLWLIYVIFSILNVLQVL